MIARKFYGFRSQLMALLTANTKWLEVVSLTFMAVWTLLMISPLDVLTTTKSFEFLNFLGEGFIAGLGSLISSLAIFGIVNQNVLARRLGLILGQFFWGTIGACFYLANFESSGGYIYGALAVLCGLGYVYGDQR